jgi:aryl-alcohol dehydrogenase-like predicted oxidoreductase
MRFRPFGITGTAVSAVSLALTDAPGRTRPSDWTALIYAAFENGINTFEIVGGDTAILDGLAVALQAVERRLLFIGLRLGASPARMGRDFSVDALLKSIDVTLARTGCGYLDVAMLDDPGMAELPPESLQALKEVRNQGRIKLLGVAGQDEAMDAYILTESFDVIATPYNLLSGWRERHRLKSSQERDMAVIGYDFYPAAVRQHTAEKATAAKGGWLRLGAKESPLKGAGTYNFLTETPGWTPEQICLAYALTEPALATVQITTEAADRMAELAAIADKDLPAGAGSRVEMARFGGQDLPNPEASKG